jgi:hypothetical protein
LDGVTNDGNTEGNPDPTTGVGPEGGDTGGENEEANDNGGETVTNDQRTCGGRGE